MNPLERLRSLEEVLDAITQALSEIETTGEQIDDDLQGMVAQEIDLLIDEITNLRRQTQAPEETQIPRGADLLWILSGQQPEVFINYARTFPDQALNQLASNPAALSQVLERLSEMMPQGQRPVADGFEQAPLNSSNIFGFQYDPRSRRLQVRFQSGAIYGYQNVPRQIFQIFAHGAVPAKTNGRNRFGRWWMGKNPSLGAAFYELIRQGNYPYQRLN